ncbi:MAG: NYN domain-containing protein [Steroidobacteraceae bacterium]|jgi:uncharacterized LabA/DUF88 family protein|nr:NYN domain-containing protein [Steroidobacteraceae bacterium]
MPNDPPATEANGALAVLIDADNANPAIVEGLLAEVAKFGVATVKRIYGDWTTPNLNSWKAVLLEHSVQPIQQFRYTTGKNATDSAMIIDAMDLLYGAPLTGFCIVSSDSDFTRLAARIRESGKRVYGFGERKTPRPFVSACDRFIYTEVFTQPPAAEQGRKGWSAKELRGDRELMKVLRAALDDASDESGWAQLGTVGSAMNKLAPDFDSRNYGYGKLSDLAKAIGLFDVEKREQRVLIREKERG